VELWTASSVTGANALVEQDALRDLPAVTYAPHADQAGDRTFRLFAGAYRDRSPADSLAAALHARGVLAAGEGRVVRVPFAVLVQSGLTRDEASFYASGFRSKGLPVYPLIQEDGLARLYAGAFEQAADASLLVATIRANGETPSVTYRTGRIP
jgi:hypothetical protein